MKYWREVLHENIFHAHQAWLYRGRTGVGQIVLRDEELGETQTNGANFRYAILERCDFDGARMMYSSFDNSEIRDCKFRRASLYNSRFLDAKLQAALFDDSDLRSCWFAGATLTACTFDESDITGGNFVRSAVDRSSFRGALLDTQLDHGEFEGCDFRNARLRGKSFGTQLVDCDLRGADLEGLRLKDTQFLRCRMAGIVGKPIVEGAFEIIEADFSSDTPVTDGPTSSAELREHWTVHPSRRR